MSTHAYVYMAQVPVDGPWSELVSSLRDFMLALSPFQKMRMLIFLIKFIITWENLTINYILCMVYWYRTQTQRRVGYHVASYGFRTGLVFQAGIHASILDAGGTAGTV